MKRDITYAENLHGLKEFGTALMIFGLLVTMGVGLIEVVVKGIITPDELKVN